MLVVGLVLSVAAALLHVVIFWLESVAWESPRARAVFGTSPEEARATRAMAFNQGFYNLFLAVLALAGVVASAVGSVVVGVTLALAGTGSMLAAALVLLVSSRAHRGAALRQGALPLLAVVVLVAWLVGAAA